MDAKKRRPTHGCCGPGGTRRRRMMGRMSCCRIEAVVSVDERGQVVLPKEIRDRAVIMHGSGEEPCCISLIQTEGLVEGVRTMLGPMMKEILG
jgi:antitoxin PrlF